METAVDFKLAKLANEKGFKSDTFWIYNKETEQCSNKWIPNGIAAPTANQLLEWIRRELKINVYCRIMDNQWGAYIERIPSGVDLTPHELICIDFVSYDTAIELGMQTALSF